MNSRDMISRRGLLMSAAALAGGAPALGATPINRNRISAITDEIARSPRQAVEFCQKYGLKWVELRGKPREDGGRSQEYFRLTDAELKEASKEFADGGLRVSFLNTSMLKYWLPGTVPSNPRSKQDPARFNNRKEEFRQAANAAHILGTDKVRIFTFWRVKDVDSVMPWMAEVIDELGDLAGREKLKLLIENEAACNVGSAAELSTLMKKIHSKNVGINWDPLNAEHSKEVAFPDGYNLLPAKRIWNVQIKGRSILEGKEWMDWAAIFRRLEKDGYRGQVGLETHIFGAEQIQRSHESMQAILRIVTS